MSHLFNLAHWSPYTVYTVCNNFRYEYTPFLEHKVPELIHLITLIARGMGGWGEDWGRGVCEWATDHLFFSFFVIFFTLQLELLNNNKKTTLKNGKKTNKHTSGQSRSAQTCCCCCPMYRSRVWNRQVPRREISSLRSSPLLWFSSSSISKQKRKEQTGNGSLMSAASPFSPPMTPSSPPRPPIGALQWPSGRER